MQVSESGVKVNAVTVMYRINEVMSSDGASLPTDNRDSFFTEPNSASPSASPLPNSSSPSPSPRTEINRDRAADPPSETQNEHNRIDQRLVYRKGNNLVYHKGNNPPSRKVITPTLLRSLECDQEILTLLSSAPKLNEKMINDLFSIIFEEMKLNDHDADETYESYAMRNDHDSLVDVLLDVFYGDVGDEFFDPRIEIDKKLSVFPWHEHNGSMSYFHWIEIGLILCGIKAGIHNTILLSEKCIDPDFVVWISEIQAPNKHDKPWDWWYIPPIVTLSLYWLGIHDFATLSQKQCILQDEHSFMNKEQARNIFQCNNDRLQLILKNPNAKHVPILGQRNDVGRFLMRFGFSKQEQQAIFYMFSNILLSHMVHFGDICNHIDLLDPDSQYYQFLENFPKQYDMPKLNEDRCRQLVKIVRYAMINYDGIDLFGYP